MASTKICVFDLRCRLCGGELSGREYDRVFFCEPCKSAFEAGDKGIEPLRYFRVEADSADPDGEINHLPIWMMEVDVKPLEATELQKERASIFFGGGRVFVPGFKMSFKGFYGDPGITLTRHWYLSRQKGAEEPFKLEPPSSENPRGCETSYVLASQFLEPILLSVIDPIVDVTGLELKIQVLEKTLLSVAFRRKGGRIRCLELSDEYPAHAFISI